MSANARKLSDPLLSPPSTIAAESSCTGDSGWDSKSPMAISVSVGAESTLTRRLGGTGAGEPAKERERSNNTVSEAKRNPQGGAVAAARAAASDREHSSRFGAHVAVATGSLVSIMKPVALTMLLAAFAVANVRNATNAAITQGLSSYMVYKDIGGGGGGGGSGG